ncbi:MAG TPA: right-handed parallel beta-helix repeat-containing protein, partial [Caulifigura sp.]|nr:right-handed parallel beta-helix repeat-containing protein [Caulifigura sp.]
MQRSLLSALLGLAVAAGSAAPCVCGAEMRVSNRAEFSQALRDARAGDHILVAAGIYAGGLSHTGLVGTKDQPIVIAAADPAQPPVIKGGGGGLHLSSPAHVVLRDLVIRDATGNGLNIDDGGSAGSAHDVVLQRLVVENIGPEGNRDGIKVSGLDRFRVEKCAVSRWGSGGSAIDMVGCHNGVITDCRFFDVTSDGANGVQAKGGSHDIVIRRNRFENAGGRGVNAGG